MNKNAIISSVAKSFSIKRSDADVLFKVASSSHQCEIDFPADISEYDRANFLKAYTQTLSLIEEAEAKAAQLAEIIPEEPHISIGDVVGEVQKGAGNGLKVEELGLRWGRGETSKEEMLALICKLYASFLKTKRIKAFLEWSIADACNMSHKLYKNLPEIVDRVSAMFGIGKYSILRMCHVARVVPVYLRVKGWGWAQYEVLIRYAPAIGPDNFYSTVRKLAKGKELNLTLSNGVTVKSHSPLTKDQIEDVLLKELKIKKKKRVRANKAGYIYLTPAGPQHSLKLHRKALSSPSVTVVDLARLSVLKTGVGPLALQEFDPHVFDFFLIAEQRNQP